MKYDWLTEKNLFYDIIIFIITCKFYLTSAPYSNVMTAKPSTSALFEASWIIIDRVTDEVTLYARRRCILPDSGFIYRWESDGRKKLAETSRFLFLWKLSTAHFLNFGMRHYKHPLWIMMWITEEVNVLLAVNCSSLVID